MQTEKFETGSGGFVWQNLQPDDMFGKTQFHVYTAFDMTVGKEWAGSQFINHYNRIYYVKSGEATLKFKEKQMVMRKGGLYLIPPYQLISHSCDDQLSFMWTHFQASIDSGVDLFMLYGEPSEVDCLNKPEVESAFTSLIDAVNKPAPSGVFARKRLLLELLHPFMCLFDEAGYKQRSLRHQSLLPSLNIMNQALANPPSLKSLAELQNMSPEHFSRKFKQAFNVSPKRYMLQKRISAAKQFLLVGDNTIEAVAEKCGFCDIFHFSRTFKRETGHSPSEFRKTYELQASQ